MNTREKKGVNLSQKNKQHSQTDQGHQKDEYTKNDLLDSTPQKQQEMVRAVAQASNTGQHIILKP